MVQSRPAHSKLTNVKPAVLHALSRITHPPVRTLHTRRRTTSWRPTRSAVSSSVNNRMSLSKSLFPPPAASSAVPAAVMLSRVAPYVVALLTVARHVLLGVCPFVHTLAGSLCCRFQIRRQNTSLETGAVSHALRRVCKPQAVRSFSLIASTTPLFVSTIDNYRMDQNSRFGYKIRLRISITRNMTHTHLIEPVRVILLFDYTPLLQCANSSAYSAKSTQAEDASFSRNCSWGGVCFARAGIFICVRSVSDFSEHIFCRTRRYRAGRYGLKP